MPILVVLLVAFVVTIDSLREHFAGLYALGNLVVEAVLVPGREVRLVRSRAPFALDIVYVPSIASVRKIDVLRANVRHAENAELLSDLAHVVADICPQLAHHVLLVRVVGHLGVRHFVAHVVGLRAPLDIITVILVFFGILDEVEAVFALLIQ
jgi:hypothetical protein